MDEYSETYEVRFSDIDANRHVNYSTYVDAAGDLRYRFFAEHGYPPERFEQLGISPVYTQITVQFLREVHMGETMTVTFAVAGISSTGMRWRAHHDIFKSNRKKAATIDMEGVLLNLATRRAVAPGPDLMQIFDLCPRTPDFEVLPELRRLR